MTTYRSSAVSPPHRRHGEAKVSVIPVFSTGFDAGFSQQSRNTIDPLKPSRAGGERLFDAQPISIRNYAASGQTAAQSKTEYSVRPLINSSPGDERRTSPRIPIPPTAPPHSRPPANDSLYDRQPRSPRPERYYLPEKSKRYIHPAVSNPRPFRNQVDDTPADPSHLPPFGRDRQDHKGYRSASSRAYPTRYDEEDDYSYTIPTPREQFDVEHPPLEHRRRRNTYISNDRPISTSDFDGWKPTPQSKRGSGPPPAVRQFDRIGKGEPRHLTGKSGNYSDTERDLAKPKRRHSLRAPVSIHQDRDEMYLPHKGERPAPLAPRYQRAYEDDPIYFSDRENYRPSSHYERRQQSGKVGEDSHDRVGKIHAIAAAGLGGLAAAGLAGALVRKPRDEDDNSNLEEPHEVKDRYKREKDHRFADSGRGQDPTMDKPWDRAAEIRDGVAPREQHREKERNERSDSDSIDGSQTEGRRHRRKHRHHRRERRPQELGSDTAADDRKKAEVAEQLDRDRPEKGPAQEDSDLSHRHRRRSHSHKQVASKDETYTEDSADSEQEDDERERTARLQLVEPPKEKEPEPKPKGILKPARQTPFPEDPNPTREGVAPHKNAGKKGIPPGARWTKIKRAWVNPEALRAAHERYEERDDYVIVLRVLSIEEIENLAHKTRKIREARELEWQERVERRRREGRSGSDDSSDEEGRPPLAIEAAPSAPSTDPRYQQAFPSEMNTRPGPDAAAIAGLGIGAEQELIQPKIG